MAADLGLNPAEQPDRSSGTGQWVWKPCMSCDDADDSWEVRAFAEDTSNILGATWPPRSYTCTFCRREFRSAQALGGHMNIHRRDRARLRHLPPAFVPTFCSSAPNSSPSAAASHLFSQRDFPAHATAADAGLCMLFTFPGCSGPTDFRQGMAGCIDSLATLLPVSNCTFGNNAPNSRAQLSDPSLSSANNGIGYVDNFSTKAGSTAQIEDVDLSSVFDKNFVSSANE